MSIPLWMFIIYTIAVPVVILVSLYGFRWKAGLWGNCIAFGEVEFSFLVAAAWWEDLASLLATQFPVMLWVADCVAFWVLFVVTLAILDTATRYMSTVNVKYANIVEKIGNALVILSLAGVTYDVYCFADDLSPVGEWSDNKTPERRREILTADTRAILMLRVLSNGNLAAFVDGNQFDARRDFRTLHLQRKQALMLKMSQGEESTLCGTEDEVGKVRRRGESQSSTPPQSTPNPSDGEEADANRPPVNQQTDDPDED